MILRALINDAGVGGAFGGVVEVRCGHDSGVKKPLAHIVSANFFPDGFDHHAVGEFTGFEDHELIEFWGRNCRVAGPCDAAPGVGNAGNNGSEDVNWIWPVASWRAFGTRDRRGKLYVEK